MSIETAVFAVQRGATTYKCKGSDISNKAGAGDLLAVQRGATTYGASSDKVQDADLLACTDTNGVTYKVTGAQFKDLFVKYTVTVDNITGTKHSDCGGQGVYVVGDQMSAVLTVSGSPTSTTKVEWIEKRYGGDVVYATGETITIPEEFVDRDITVRATILEGGVEKDSNELTNALTRKDVELIVVTHLEGVIWKYPNSGNWKYKDVRFVCSNYQYIGVQKYKPITSELGVEIQPASGTGNTETHCYYSGTGTPEVTECDFYGTPYIMVRVAFSENGDPSKIWTRSNWNCLILASGDMKVEGVDGAVPPEFTG